MFRCTSLSFMKIAGLSASARRGILQRDAERKEARKKKQTERVPEEHYETVRLSQYDRDSAYIGHNEGREDEAEDEHNRTIKISASEFKELVQESSADQPETDYLSRAQRFHDSLPETEADLENHGDDDELIKLRQSQGVIFLAVPPTLPTYIRTAVLEQLERLPSGVGLEVVSWANPLSVYAIRPESVLLADVAFLQWLQRHVATNVIFLTDLVSLISCYVIRNLSPTVFMDASLQRGGGDTSRRGPHGLFADVALTLGDECQGVYIAKNENSQDNVYSTMRENGLTNFRQLTAPRPNLADVVLCCPDTSQSGWRNRPVLDDEWSRENIPTKTKPVDAGILTRSLSNAASVLRPHGYVVYVTSSVYSQENEEIVDTVLQTTHPVHKDPPMSLVDCRPFVPKCFVGESKDPAGYFLRVDPQEADTDAVFLAIMQVGGTGKITPEKSLLSPVGHKLSDQCVSFFQFTAQELDKLAQRGIILTETPSGLVTGTSPLLSQEEPSVAGLRLLRRIQPSGHYIFLAHFAALRCIVPLWNRHCRFIVMPSEHLLVLLYKGTLFPEDVAKMAVTASHVGWESCLSPAPHPPDIQPGAVLVTAQEDPENIQVACNVVPRPEDGTWALQVVGYGSGDPFVTAVRDAICYRRKKDRKPYHPREILKDYGGYRDPDEEKEKGWAEGRPVTEEKARRAIARERDEFFVRLYEEANFESAMTVGPPK